MSYVWLALLAAVIWGLHFTLISHLTVNGINPVTIFFLPSLLMLVLLPWILPIVVQDTKTVLMTGDNLLKYGYFALIFTSFAASMALYKALSTGTHPVIVSLIDISYPVFVAVFSMVLLGHGITLTTIIGGVIVFIGIAVIIFGGG